MAPKFSPWTDEKLAQLKSCIDRKLSRSQTAKEMGTTPNQCGGKAHRMGWKFLSVSGHPKKPKRPPTAAFITQKKTLCHSIPLPAPSSPYAGFLGISLFDLPENACHFIEGEGSPALFCGQPADGPWCSHHKKLCYHEIKPSLRENMV